MEAERDRLQEELTLARLDIAYWKERTESA